MSDILPISLEYCNSYEKEDLRNIVGNVLEKAQFPIKRGMRILVKPNLLQSTWLACTDARIVCACCEWLLDFDAKLIIGDNPAFGSERQVAYKIGLIQKMEKLGLKITSLKKSVKIKLNANDSPVIMPISRDALNCDAILSIPRIKAHSQMRLTLAVKNCFGCVPGLSKALIHVRYGKNRQFFAECLVALYKILPPVWGFADGIIAMNITGPSRGVPYNLNLLGACTSAHWLDYVLIKLLGIDPGEIPVMSVILNMEEVPNLDFPLLKPESFYSGGFEVPKKLKNVSFNPLQLTKSLFKRIFYNIVT